MSPFPPTVLKKLYVKSSLRANGEGFTLDLQNVLAPGTIIAFDGLDLDGKAVAPEQITLVPSSGKPRPACKISTESPVQFPINAPLTLHAAGQQLTPGPHEIVIHITFREVGLLTIPIGDTARSK